MLFRSKKNHALYDEHHLDTWPFTRGHTNMNRCLFSTCFMFVSPHVNSPLAFSVACQCSLSLSSLVKCLYTTFFTVAPSFLPRHLLLNSVSRYPRSPASLSLPQVRLHTTPRILGNGRIVWMCLLSCCQYIAFSRWLSIPATGEQ